VAPPHLDAVRALWSLTAAEERGVTLADILLKHADLSRQLAAALTEPEIEPAAVLAIPPFPGALDD
jgi:hypothetical protein